MRTGSAGVWKHDDQARKSKEKTHLRCLSKIIGNKHDTHGRANIPNAKSNPKIITRPLAVEGLMLWKISDLNDLTAPYTYTYSLWEIITLEHLETLDALEDKKSMAKWIFQFLKRERCKRGNLEDHACWVKMFGNALGWANLNFFPDAFRFNLQSNRSLAKKDNVHSTATKNRHFAFFRWKQILFTGLSWARPLSVKAARPWIHAWRGGLVLCTTTTTTTIRLI